MTAIITGHTRLAGLLGNPTRHSISPEMHTTAFEKTGIDAVYLSFDIKENEVADAISAIRTLSFIGANVTMPYKMAVIPHLDQLTPAAKLIGAVNTIVPKNGKLEGHNTDGIGFMRSLVDLEVDPIGKQLTILGAGGASTAIIAQAALDGVKTIHVFNRKDHFYDQIHEKLAKIAQATGCDIALYDLAGPQQQLADSLATSCLLVNATRVGMAPALAEMALPEETLLHPDLAVYDVIYEPRQTHLLKVASERGLKTANGLGMLLYQGAAAFEAWTGKEMPLAAVRPLLNN